MSYIDDHRASGFQVGDRVRVFAVCKSYSEGWLYIWTDGMNRRVGLEDVIESDGGGRGFLLRTACAYFPWHVLEKIND